MITEARIHPGKRGAPSYVFLNGDMVLEDEALVSIRDRGFLYGDGIFETLRSYDGKPFLLREHLQRLDSSAQALEIPLTYSPQELRKAVESLLVLNKVADAIIRITLTRGESPHYGLQPPKKHTPTLIIQCHPFQPHPEEYYKNGLNLIISTYLRSVSCPIFRHKTANFLTAVMAKQEATRKGAHDALFLNTNGHVCEATTSNIFLVESGKVITPSLEANILPGITREKVLELCKQEGIPASEELFDKERLCGAEEVFLTNSLAEIVPVSQIEDKPISKPVPGKLTCCVTETYKKLVEVGSSVNKPISF